MFEPLVTAVFEKLVTMRPEQGLRQLELSILTSLTHFSSFEEEQMGFWNQWKKIIHRDNQLIALLYFLIGYG